MNLLKLFKNKIFRIFTLDNIISTILVLLVLKFLPIFFQIDFLDPIQNTLQDFQITDIAFSQLMHQDSSIDSNIVLVNISKLERRDVARQVEILNRYKPKIIGVDGFFRELQGVDQDIPLAKAFSEVGHLVLVSKISNLNPKTGTWDSIETSHPIFSKYSHDGYSNFIINDDQFRTVRIFTPAQVALDTPRLAFAVEIAKYYRPEAVEEFLARRNETEIINFLGNSERFLTYDFKQFFKDSTDFSIIKDKIVLMGYIGPTLNVLTNEDMFFTPMNDKYVGKSYPDMYGVVVWANIISMILRGEYYYQIPEIISQILTILIIFSNMVLFSYLREKRESWYEPVSIIWTFVQLFLLIFLILGVFYFFNLELKFEGVFFALFISKQAYETWVDSLKVMIIGTMPKIYMKFFGRKNRGEVS